MIGPLEKRYDLVVVVVAMVVIPAMVVAVTVAHRIADRRATNAANDGADWTAYNRSTNCACDSTSDGAALISQRC